MMGREDFVQYAAVHMMHTANDADAQKRHAVAARESAEALAAELGLVPLRRQGALEAQGAGEEIATLAGELEGTRRLLTAKEGELAVALQRIVDLEQDLERATAPKGRTR